MDAPAPKTLIQTEKDMAEKEDIRAAYQSLVNVLIKSVKSAMEAGNMELCDEVLACAGEIMGNGAETLVGSGILSDEQALTLNDRLLDMEVLFNAMKEEEEKKESQVTGEGSLEIGEVDCGLS